jgi:hypothetical protein
MAVVCCFCGGELSTREIGARFLFCNRRQQRPNVTEIADATAKSGVVRKPGDIWHEHSVEAKASTDDRSLVTWNEQVPPPYLEASEQGRVRFVSVFGPWATGKTVWLLSVGHHAAENPAIRIYSANSAAKDQRRMAVEQLPLGKLPVRTDVRLELSDIPMLPMAFSQGLGMVKDGLGMGSKVQNEICIVLKDVGGESARTRTAFEFSTELNTRHLFHSDWLVLALDASDNAKLRSSSFLALDFLNHYENHQATLRKSLRWYERLPYVSKRGPAGLVVMLTRVDSRHRMPNDRVFEAVRCEPNRWPDVSTPRTPGFLDRYLEKMRDVQQEVHMLLKGECPLLMDRIEKLFDPNRTNYSAISSLGLAPVRRLAFDPTDPNGIYEGQCITEPALVRVMDPILWIMKAEKTLIDGPSRTTNG